MANPPIPIAPLVALIALASLAEAVPARAQEDNAAAVEALFADGKRLMSAGKTAEACPKFLASYNLERRIGTVLNLAACYEKNGQLASAWARFIEARTLAARANQPERVAFAGQHAAALEPRRSALTITVDPAPGLVVRRDGVVIEPAAYGVAVPLDGGAHLIEATAPGRKPLAATVNVKPEGDRQAYALGSLLPSASPADDVHQAPAPRTHGASARAIAGVGIATAGVIAAGIGVAFGVQALSKNSESNANGDCAGNACNASGFAARTAARSDGDLASVLIGAGAAAAVGGAVLWLTAPSASATRASAQRFVIGVGPSGIDVRGVF